ncbi:hypothetical protein M404DRAFT_994497 [Pisolithus tinctorius Marx 270]|uniref:Uncharacterized protein n=1 Tax=Pisolithus tinctorius Marx 270 TaxID=870435 RepID=A0A0C3KQR9_PISTI|nr:hypothetical protein M404DRAFT_994497 [Pisolithus tinctorius Marx 270]
MHNPRRLIIASATPLSNALLSGLVFRALLQVYIPFNDTPHPDHTITFVAANAYISGTVHKEASSSPAK